jgi:predicted restriction endonuclease
MRVKQPCAFCGRIVERVPAEVKKSKSGNLFCNSSCSSSFNNQKRKNENNPNWIDGVSNYRARALEEYGEACTICGYDVLENLEVHHRDRNRKNNALKNLDVLCPTHHKEFERGLKEYVGIQNIRVYCNYL